MKHTHTHIHTFTAGPFYMLEPFQDKQWGSAPPCAPSVHHHHPWPMGPVGAVSRLVSYICWFESSRSHLHSNSHHNKRFWSTALRSAFKREDLSTPRCTRLDPSVLSDGPVARFPVLLIHDDSWVRPTAASRPEKNINTHISSTHPFFLTLSFIQIHTQGCIVYRSGGLDI